MNTEITPAHIDGLINAWVRIDAMVTTYGPGLALAAAIVAVVWACRRTAEAVHDRIAVAAARRQLRADHQPGHDQQLLADCWNAWNAEAREEKP